MTSNLRNLLDVNQLGMPFVLFINFKYMKKSQMGEKPYGCKEFGEAFTLYNTPTYS
jgi:hypothetical protein